VLPIPSYRPIVIAKAAANAIVLAQTSASTEKTTTLQLHAFVKIVVLLFNPSPQENIL
jgi:hypothetical protein